MLKYLNKIIRYQLSKQANAQGIQLSKIKLPIPEEKKKADHKCIF